MFSIQQKYFQATFPNYFSSTLHEFINSDDHTSIFNVTLLSNKIFALFEKHIREPHFYKITTQILQETFNRLRNNFENGHYSLKELKQILFLQLYLQKMHFKFQMMGGQDMNETLLNKIIWEIRLELQFSNAIGDSQDFINSLLIYLQIQKSSQKFKKRVHQLFSANQFDLSANKLFFSEEKEPPTPKQQIKIQAKNIFCKVQQDMARNQIKKEVKMKDSIQSTNSKLISNLKKKKKERSSHDVGIGGGRTLYFSHPVKFLAKSEDRFHGIVEYVDTDSCF